jgi:hypothetical protein
VRKSLALIIGAALASWLLARHRRSVVRLALSLAARQLRPSFDWDPISWAESVGGWIVGAGSRAVDDIKALIVKVVGDAIKAVNDSLHDAVRGLTDAIGAVSDGVNSVLDWIGNADSWLAAHIFASLQTFWGWAGALVAQWLDDLRSWASDALDALGRVLTDAINAVSSAVDWVVANLIDPVLHWIDQAAEFVGHVIDVWWDAVWSATIGPALDLLDHVWGLVQQLWHFLTVVWVDVWHVLDKAWGWLVWLGEHTFDDLLALFSGTAEGITPDGVKALAHPNAEVLQLLSDGFERVIG